MRLSVAANVLARGLSISAVVLGVRWTVPYLGTQRFGIWMTVLSLTAMLTFLDLGVGNALTNRVAACATKAGEEALQRAVSGGLLLLAGIGTAAILLLFPLAALMPLHWLIKDAEPAALVEARTALIALSVLFGMNLLAVGVGRVFVGLQRSYECHAVSALGSVLSIAALWLAAQHHADIATLLVVTFGIQQLLPLVLLLRLRRERLLRWREAPRCARREARALVRMSGLFLILQIGTMVGWGADQAILSAMIGPASVAVYNVAQRLCQFVSQPLAMVNAPLWGAYADAAARHDGRFIGDTLRRSLVLTATAAALGAVVLWLAGDWLVAHWTQRNIALPRDVLVAALCWMMLDSIGTALGTYLNGIGILRPQIVTVIALSTLAIPAKLWACQAFGVAGLVGSYCIVFFLVHCVTYGCVFRRSVFRTVQA